jgi:class 3 adenylate cyclase
MLELFLLATRVGLLELRWEVLCPLCRGPKEQSQSLAGLRLQVHCNTCNIDYGANFERSVELTFRPNPAIRRYEPDDFCVAGPQVTPHIIVQQLMQPGESRDISLPLDAGRYRVRALELPGGQFLAAAPDGSPEMRLAASSVGWPSDEGQISTRPTLHLVNSTRDEQLMILERMAWSDQAATAAEVTAMQTFRDLFANETLRPGEQVTVGSLTVVFTDLRESTRFYREVGDARAFGLVMSHFDLLKVVINANDGAIVKTIGDSVMAVFRRPSTAVRAMLQAQQELGDPAANALPFSLRVGIHYGPCVAVNLNDRLDYFGSTVNIAARLESLSTGEEIVISDAVRRDPEVTALLGELASQLNVHSVEATLKGFEQDKFDLYLVAPKQRFSLVL